jgi:hypothetical protein
MKMADQKTQKSELDLELEKVGATLSKVATGALQYLETGVEAAAEEGAKIVSDIAAKIAPTLENVLTNLGTALITKTLAKYGINI